MVLVGVLALAVAEVLLALAVLVEVWLATLALMMRLGAQSVLGSSVRSKIWFPQSP